MRGLAEFVMSGRRQAILAALLTGVLPLVNFLSPAIVGLVCLRFGVREGLLVLIWALLPALGWSIAGDVTPLVLLLGVSALALVLRQTSSWQAALLAAVGVGLGTELALALQPEFLTIVLEQVRAYLDTAPAQNELGSLGDEDELRGLLVSFIGAMHMLLALGLLIVSRWWQAMLYNPGGFRQEFHELRLGYRVALVLLLLILLANLGIPLLQSLGLYLLLPLFFAGLALVHGVAAKKKLSRLWLVAFYLVMLNPITLQILILFALIDSWYDFRSRITTNRENEEEK